MVTVNGVSFRGCFTDVPVCTDVDRGIALVVGLAIEGEWFFGTVGVESCLSTLKTYLGAHPAVTSAIIVDPNAGLGLRWQSS